MANGSFDRRAELHPDTVFGWLWLNFGPLLPFALAAAAIFDDAHAAKWAALAAATAGLTGGGTLPKMMGNGTATKAANKLEETLSTPPPVTAPTPAALPSVTPSSPVKPPPS